jgi:chromosome segregation ATPase
LGVHVQCEERETFIQEILQHEENVQQDLMYLISKIINKSKAERSMDMDLDPDSDLNESLTGSTANPLIFIPRGSFKTSSILQPSKMTNQQSSTIIKMLEDEKLKLNNQITEMCDKEEKTEKVLEKSKKRIRELEKNELELRKANDALKKGDALDDTQLGGDIVHIEEMETELQIKENKIGELETILHESEDKWKEKVSDLKDELFLANDRIRGVENTQKLLDKAKKKIESLQDVNSKYKEMKDVATTYSERVTKLENDLAHAKDVNKQATKLRDQLKKEKDKNSNLEIEITKLKSNVEKGLKDKINLEKKYKFLETKFKSLNTENERLKTHDPASIEKGSSLLSDKMASEYEERITKLEKENDLLRMEEQKSIKSELLSLENKVFFPLFILIKI